MSHSYHNRKYFSLCRFFLISYPVQFTQVAFATLTGFIPVADFLRDAPAVRQLLQMVVEKAAWKDGGLQTALFEKAAASGRDDH
jgi:hypothetical protein